MFKNHKSNSQLKVDGKMNEQDAGQVGKMPSIGTHHLGDRCVGIDGVFGGVVLDIMVI